MAKYKPQVGDEIEFFYKQEKFSGTVDWIASSGVVSVYPNTMVFKDRDGTEMDMDWFVEPSEIIGEVKKDDVQRTRSHSKGKGKG